MSLFPTGERPAGGGGAALALAALFPLACAVPTVTGGGPPHARDEETIRVEGSATLTIPADLLEIELGVVTRAASADEAMARNAAAMERVLAAVRTAVGDRGEIKTAQLSLHAEAPPMPPPRPLPAGGPPASSGYVARNLALVRSTDVRGAAEIIDAAMSAGANQVHGLSFSLSDPEQAELRALRAAAADARQRAAVLAAATGQRIGPVLFAAAGDAPEPPAFRTMALEGPGAQRIEPGGVEVRARVRVLFQALNTGR